MKILIGLTILIVVAVVNCHPAFEIQNDAETLEGVDVNAGLDANVNTDAEISRKTRSFIGRRPCCGGGFGGGGFGGGGYGRRRPYYGGGGFGRPYGGGGGGFSSASASASASSSSFGFGK
ncbi:hypothetical protein FF38_02027 [Lucilia cuprina]|uniref:Uncharacterized protein n=1 Tax=Lucilia cuprina TaxID=7375 RepID=A0A0L0BLN4_LUCCU|nr:hypothetical protein FF38_02027 [Lucilia cuprina]